MASYQAQYYPSPQEIVRRFPPMMEVREAMKHYVSQPDDEEVGYRFYSLAENGDSFLFPIIKAEHARAAKEEGLERPQRYGLGELKNAKHQFARSLPGTLMDCLESQLPEDFQAAIGTVREVVAQYQHALAGMKELRHDVWERCRSEYEQEHWAVARFHGAFWDAVAPVAYLPEMDARLQQALGVLRDYCVSPSYCGFSILTDEGEIEAAVPSDQLVALYAAELAGKTLSATTMHPKPLLEFVKSIHQSTTEAILDVGVWPVLDSMGAIPMLFDGLPFYSRLVDNVIVRSIHENLDYLLFAAGDSRWNQQQAAKMLALAGIDPAEAADQLLGQAGRGQCRVFDDLTMIGQEAFIAELEQLQRDGWEAAA